jgi:hypothetical protein
VLLPPEPVLDVAPPEADEPPATSFEPPEAKPPAFAAPPELLPPNALVEPPAPGAFESSEPEHAVSAHPSESNGVSCDRRRCRKTMGLFLRSRRREARQYIANATPERSLGTQYPSRTEHEKIRKD